MTGISTLDPEVEITAETITIPENITEIGCTWHHEHLDDDIAVLMQALGRVFIRGCSQKVVAHVQATRCHKAPASFICRNALDFFNATLQDPREKLCRGCVASHLPDPDVKHCWKVVIL